VELRGVCMTPQRKPLAQALLQAPGEEFLIGIGAARQDDAEEDVLFDRVAGLLETAQEREATSRRGRSASADTMSLLSDAESEASEADSEAEDDEVSSVASSSSGRGSRSRSSSYSSETSMMSPSPTSALDLCEEVYNPLSKEELEIMHAQLLERRMPSMEDAFRLVSDTRRYLKEECGSLVRLARPAGRMIVVGDLHGHFSDLLHVYNSYGPPTEYNQYLFNGDFVDRGVWGPEVLFTLFCMKLLYKNAVFLNRGNHESELCTDLYGFKTHLACAYPRNHHLMHRMVHACFNELPLCYVVGGEVCVIHGGLPKFSVSLRDIARLRRGPVPFPGHSTRDRLFQALLWSDPKDKRGRSDRGLGWHFSERDTRAFLGKNGLKRLVRSHECFDGGYCQTHSDLVTTVFSASNYTGHNNACVVTIDSRCAVAPGPAWNEEYFKLEWVEEMAKQIDFHRLDFGESKSFHDFDVEIMRTEKINVNLSVDQLFPVFLAIDEGCIASFNRRNPHSRILLGDAILAVNGIAAYDKEALERLKREPHLKVRIRRPQRILHQLARADCPPLDQLHFEDGYAFAEQDWGVITRFDRIVSVNGVNTRAAMYQQMQTAELLSLEILRYAPADFCIQSPSERRQVLLRKVSSAAWEDGDADHRAIEALLNRVGGQIPQLAHSTKSRVLEDLRSMIFMHRPQLLEAFAIKDKADSYIDLDGGVFDYRGIISEQRWAEVMETTLKTPHDFPWLDLRPYLCELEEDGDIAYVKFLLRFNNLLSKWLIGQWCEAALDEIVHHLELSHRDEFELLDVDRLGKISYAGLKPFFRKHLFTAEPKTKRERRSRELQYFALFSKMDVENSGFVMRKHFVRMLNRRKTMTARVCTEGHKLQDDFLPWWQGRMDRRHCNDCRRQIRRREARRWCDRCEFEICAECTESREEDDITVITQSRTVGQRNIVHWYMVDKVLQILCASHCDVWSVFFPAGVGEKEAAVITKADFVDVVGDLLDGDTSGAAEFFELMQDYLGNHARLVDNVPAGAVVECLRVQDLSLLPDDVVH